MNKKFPAILLGCAMLGGLALLIQTPEVREHRVLAPVPYTSPELIRDKPVQPVESFQPKKKEVLFTPAEILIINTWLKKHGYMLSVSANGKVSLSGNQGYLHYDNHTLLRLAKSGDTIAANTLGARAISSEHLLDNRSAQENSDIQHALLDATARGLTSSIDQLIILKTQDYIQSYDRKLKTFDSSHIIDAYAYLNILKLRRSIDTELREYSLQMARKLSASEYALARQRTAEIYAFLLQRRAELGMGPFENADSAETQALLQRFFRALDQGEIA